MTVSSSTDRATFPGNGATTVFPLPFRFFANGEVNAWLITNATGALTPLTLGTHYTLTGASEPEVDGSATGQLTMITPPTSAQSLFVQRIIPVTQPTDILNQGQFFPEIHENVFDRLTMLLQQAAGESKGAIRVAIGDPEPARLPNAISRALLLLGFDSAGNPIAVAPSSGSSADLAMNLANDTDPAKGAALVPTTARVVATVATIRSLPDAGSRTAFALGHTVFALGGGVYSQDVADVTSADNNGSVIVAASGMRWKLTDTTMLTPFHFGARGDKVTDDTAAIQACYDAVKAGGTMYIPRAPGDAYIVSKQGTNTYVLNFSRVVNIKSDGLLASLQPAAGTLVNTVLLKPDPAFSYQGMEWDGLSLGDPYTGTRAGIHGIFIDTDVAGSNLPTCSFSRLNIGTGSAAGARAIVHVNNATNNVNGAMYATTISKCPMLKGGIDLQASGDSNAIHSNIISGPNIGISVSLISGASLLAIVENNITSLGGAIKISAGSRYKILRNNCEQTDATAGVVYMFDIDGAAGTMSMGEIRGNHLGAFTATGITANIRIANNIGAVVSDNVMLPASAGGIGVQIDAGANGTKVGPNIYGSAITTANRIADAGTGTVGVVKAPTFLNGWVNFGAGYAAASFYKDAMGIVHLSGTIKSGTATPGTILFTLPSGFRPSALVAAPVSQNAGAGAVFGAVDITSGGDVVIQAGANAQFSLDGVSFRAVNESNSVSDL